MLSEPSDPHVARSARPVALVALGSVLVALAFVTWRPDPRAAARSAWDLIPGVLCVALLLFGYLALSVSRLRASLQERAVRQPGLSVWAFAWPGALWAGTVAYAASRGYPVIPRAVAYGLYVAVPVLLLRAGSGAAGRGAPGHATAPRRPGRAARVASAMVLLLVPAALRLLPRLSVPGVGGTDVSKYLGIATCAWCFLVLAPIPGVGYVLRLDRRGAGVALAGFASYAAVALPVGLMTGFLTWAPRADARRLLLLPVLLLVTTATAEELAFRGVVQRTIEVAASGAPWGRWLALAVASVLFGLAHLPDPRYVALATLAGAVYGLVYQRTGQLLAPVLTHTLVDWIWALFLKA